MRAGRMRHTIWIQSHNGVRDTSGGLSSEGWTTITDGVRWAEVKPVGSSERFQDQQLQEIVTHKITTRYLSGITTRHRVLYVTSPSNRTFDIQSVIDWGERHRELSLMCVERMAA